MAAAEVVVMDFQSREFARAAVMYYDLEGDLELAYQLQLNEALAASAALSGISREDFSEGIEGDGAGSSSHEDFSEGIEGDGAGSSSHEDSREGIERVGGVGGVGGAGAGRGYGGDRSMAFRVQSGEMQRRGGELKDKGDAEKAARGLGVEMKQRWHDREFPRSIAEMQRWHDREFPRSIAEMQRWHDREFPRRLAEMQRWYDREFARRTAEMPDKEWEARGDKFERPFVVEHDGDGYGVVGNQVYSLYFATVREDPGNVAMAWAVTDEAGHVLFQQSKFLGVQVDYSTADYTALINGLAYARSIGVRQIAVHGDSLVIWNQVSNNWKPRNTAQASFLEQVRNHRDELDSFSLDVVAPGKNQYVVGLARQAIQSHVAEVIKNRSAGQMPSESIGKGPTEDCPICFENARSADMFTVRNCAHKFCLSCLSHHVETQVKAHQVPVRCPQECLHHLELDQCRPFLSARLLESYAKCLTEASIPEADRVYCPFPNCSALMVKGGMKSSVMGSSSNHPHATSIGRTECMECHRLFCVECQVPWHANMSCADYQKFRPDGRDAEDIKLFQLASDKNWQRCEKCRRMIELSHGCDHMICRCVLYQPVAMTMTRRPTHSIEFSCDIVGDRKPSSPKCGHEFCYRCGGDWKNTSHVGCFIKAQNSRMRRTLSHVDHPRTSLESFQALPFG